MMSGSAALPVAMLERWREITGHVLLERYGMTEIGMALSNPLARRAAAGTRRPAAAGRRGAAGRRAGRRGGGRGHRAKSKCAGRACSCEYWRRPDDTRAAFRDGWFRTGDVGVLEDGQLPAARPLSVDIIKTGGYKVSALEIEDVLRAHPAVADCAVVGAPTRAGASACAPPSSSAPAPRSHSRSCRPGRKARLAPYKVPKDLTCVPALPRNAMGKVVKPQVSAWFK